MIETMTAVVSLAQQLYDLSETVKANGAQCRLLVEHVRLVSHSVRELDRCHAVRAADTQCQVDLTRLENVTRQERSKRSATTKRITRR